MMRRFDSFFSSTSIFTFVGHSTLNCDQYDYAVQ
jgi:hypothetical protein